MVLPNLVKGSGFFECLDSTWSSIEYSRSDLVATDLPRHHPATSIACGKARRSIEGLEANYYERSEDNHWSSQCLANSNRDPVCQTHKNLGRGKRVGRLASGYDGQYRKPFGNDIVR